MKHRGFPMESKGPRALFLSSGVPEIHRNTCQSNKILGLPGYFSGVSQCELTEG